MPIPLLKIKFKKLNNKTLVLLTWSQSQLTWAPALKLIILFMETGEITKTVTLATIFHKPVGESNMYVHFGYGQLTIL